MTIEFHPLANIFPLIEGEDFDALVADVRANGIHDLIDLYQGKILDGRNRYRAAAAAGIELEKRHFRHFHAEFYGDPLAYVISKNLKRRHLDSSQRAMVAARLATMRQGERTDLEPSANLPKVDQPTAARKLSISERALRHARAVQDRGAPELVRAVERGRLAVSVAERASRLSLDVQRQIAAAAEAGDANAARSVVKKAARSDREAALGERQCALPQKKFGVIYADPEWRFEPWSRETGLDRAADNHYPTSCTEVIAARDVPAIAADDCVLFLWATAPMLPHALVVMSAWGFDYVSNYVWDKVKVGTGYWNRNVHEHLLIGTRGSKLPAPAMGTQFNSIIEAKATRHSAKPEIFLEMIEQYFPTLPKIELNRRGPPRKGWEAWGNEAQPGEFDPDTGEIIESEAEIPPPAPSASPAPASAAPHAADAGASTTAGFIEEVAPEPPISAQTEHDVTTGLPPADDDELLDIPAFLKRNPDGSWPQQPGGQG